VDALFQQYQGTSNNTIGEMGILLGSDKIDIGTGGSLTINGQAMGDGTYLNGEVTKSNGTITIQTPNYTIVVTDGGGYLDTNFTATGVGSAGVPGGLWGQSLNGENVDTNASDFQVANLWAPNTGGYGLGSASAMMAQLQEVLASDMALDASRNVVKSPS
jgi:hypothetical protein